MAVCAWDFDEWGPRPEDPDHSRWEWSFYSGIPCEKETQKIPNHRLSLRKNLGNGMFEVYRHYEKRVTKKLEGAVLDTSVDLHREDVIFEGEFLGAVEFGNSEVLRYHGSGTFEICRGCLVDSRDPTDHH